MLRPVAAVCLAFDFSAELASAQGPLGVWTESSLQRIGVRDETGPTRDVDLTGARGEVLSFQIAIRSYTAGTTVDGVAFTDFSDG